MVCWFFYQVSFIPNAQYTSDPMIFTYLESPTKQDTRGLTMGVHAPPKPTMEALNGKCSLKKEKDEKLTMKKN